MTPRVEAVRGDLTAQHVDAVVNAANSSLLGGGGVDGAIHAAAGPVLDEECRRLRRTAYPDGLPTGAAVVTDAGDLPARYVIHTVGPRRWEHHDGGAGLLASCHQASLAVADTIAVAAIAFPAISCGAFGWSADQAAPVAVRAVRDYFRGHPDSGITLVRFVLRDESAWSAFDAACSGE